MTLQPNPLSFLQQIHQLVPVPVERTARTKGLIGFLVVITEPMPSRRQEFFSSPGCAKVPNEFTPHDQ